MSYSVFPRSSQAIRSTDKKVVRRALAYVLRKFRALGMKLPAHRLQLFLVDKAMLCRLACAPLDSGILGLTLTDSTPVGHYYCVYLLDNQPIFLHLETLAHEMGHVWLYENVHDQNRKSPQEIEGFCELVAFKTLEFDLTMAALSHRNEMLQNPDPIYGYGLRMMKARADAVGWNTFLHQLRKG